MKIQHWAIIFIIIILPLSITVRNTINKKNLNLRDETKYNNIIDNATYDAVSQILEISEELGYGKNIPITENVAMAAIDRFFNTLSVNFNLPINEKNAEAYFGQYVPAIIIVGYDGLYVYSCENTNNGYEFKLKPKIPYAYTYEYGVNEQVIINFTLDNYVTLFFPKYKFMVGIPDAENELDGTHLLSGYVGEPLDIDNNGISDLNDFFDENLGLFIECTSGDENQYKENDDPFGLNLYENYTTEKIDYIKNQIPTFTENLSYVLKQWNEAEFNSNAKGLEFLYLESKVPNQDYVYNDNKDILVEASEFHKLRRETIINLITAVMKEEFNEHNDYTKALGVTYNFNLPDIGRDQWNNTIDDISVLAFFQGMPIGTDMYYNNYSLGGARIVKANYLYAERVYEGNTKKWHDVYHKSYCRLITRYINGNIIYASPDLEEGGDGYIPNGKLPNGLTRYTSGIKNIYVNSEHAKEEHYYMCSECM